MFSVSAVGGGRTRQLTMLVVAAVFISLVVVVSTPASAASGDVTGSEVTTLQPGLPDVIHRWSLDAREQRIWNNASNGTFTLTFKGESGAEETTAALPFNATNGQVQTALDNLNLVTVTPIVDGIGTSGDPWIVTFPNPQRPVYALVADDSSLEGSTTTIEAHRDLPVDPSGIAHIGGGNLLISDFKIDEIAPFYAPFNHNTWTVNVNNGANYGQAPTAFGNTTAFSSDPNGLAYNPSTGRLFVSDALDSRVYDVQWPGASSWTSLATASVGVPNVRDVAYDSASGTLFVAGPTKIVPVAVGSNGRIGGSNDVAGPAIDLSGIVLNIEGLAYRPATDTLLLTDVVPGTRLHITEVTRSGRLVRVYQMPFTTYPSDIEIAPGSPGGSSVYVVDPRTVSTPGLGSANPIDARFYELAIPFANLRPYVNAGSNKSVVEGKALTLVGDSYDDNQKASPTVTWSKLTGPGNVTFGNAAALTTTATFSKAGNYTLRLRSSDGSYASTDDVNVTVTMASNGGGGPGSGGDGMFVDDDGHTFEADIEWMAGEGITKGCNPPTNDRFCPDDYVTRGQMAAFLVRTLGYSAGAGSNLFVDDDGNTFEADINRLGTAGVTKGCNPPSNSRYCPDEFVTRGQMAAFLVRAFGYTAGADDNLFKDDNGNTFEADIDRLGTAGVTKGCNPPTNDRYCPNEFVTRGQMAAFIHRAKEG